jgi:hypothetical protein
MLVHNINLHATLLIWVLVYEVVVILNLITSNIFLLLSATFPFDKSLKHELSKIKVLWFVLVNLSYAPYKFKQMTRELCWIISFYR